MSVITQLTTQNYKKIKAVTIRPDGSTVQITGKNAQGKTSLLDSIAALLGGKKFMDSTPIRQGADKAIIEAQLDNGLLVRRTITQGGGGALTITNAAGAKLPSAQLTLDTLIPSLLLDPLAFSRMKPIDRRDQVQRMVGLDFTELDTQHKAAFDARRDVNRDAEALRVQLAAKPEHAGAPDEEVSVAELLKEHTAAQAVVSKLADLQKWQHTAEQDCARLSDDINELHKRLAEKQAQKVAAQRSVENLKHEHVLLSKDAPNVTAIADRMANAENVNAKVRENAARANLQAAYSKKSEEADRLTGELNRIEKARRDAVAAAKFPIEGLSFDEGGLYYKGQPFDQASGAEKLRVSIAIALAQMPDLKVLLIRDGSLLDTDNLTMIAEMADEAGAQVWIERVDSGFGIEIVEGEIAPAA